jgi:hypothetical protein
MALIDILSKLNFGQSQFMGDGTPLLAIMPASM